MTSIPDQRAEGEVLLDGENILSPKQDLNLLRSRIGMVFQKPTPFPMSIYDNIAFGIRPLREAAPKRDGRARRVGAATRRPVERGEGQAHANGLSLSGGQQQRLCIARTIAVKPEVILLDEPASALDPISTAKIEELIDELKADYTIVIVTHNMQQAARVSDYTAFMYLGELIEFGETARIFTAPARPAHAGLHHGPLRLKPCSLKKRADHAEHTVRAFDTELEDLRREHRRDGRHRREDAGRRRSTRSSSTTAPRPGVIAADDRGWTGCSARSRSGRS